MPQSHLENWAPYLRDLRALLNDFNYQAAFYGHFGHGCIHMHVSFDLESENGIRKYSEFIDRAADLVLSYGGSLSGEHGDGQSRAALLPKMFGPELMKALSEFKAAWDPTNGMNPHKVIDPYLPTENLRLGADYKPLTPETHFKFPEDDGSFAKATLRCIGLGACRKQDSGSMCPSYMVTLEEEHSTRGRAHMLFELLQGEVIRDGWQDEQVKESLWTCAWRARLVSRNAPRTWTSRRTKRNSCLIFMRANRRSAPRIRVFGMIDKWLEIA